MNGPKGRHEVIRVLIEGGADPNKIGEKEWRLTPLHQAATDKEEDVDNEDVARALLEGGAELDPVDKHGRTPLNHAAFDGHKKVAKLLLEKGADPNLAGSIHGDTPLHLASRGVIQGFN